MDKELWKRVSKTQEDFIYTRKAAGDGAEIWHCGKRGSSTYAFDISISRMNISVNGDIGALAFRVGASYGMDFLAGNDINYYIKSKLEEEFNKVVLDKDQARIEACEEIGHAMAVYLQDLPGGGFNCRIPEWINKDNYNQKDCKMLKLLLVREKQKVKPYTDAYRFLDNSFDFLKGIEDGGDYGEFDLRGMYEHFYSCGIKHVYFEEVSFENPCPSIMFKLYMVNYAAKKIIEIKKQLQKETDELKSKIDKVSEYISESTEINLPGEISIDLTNIFDFALSKINEGAA